jgi:hypothetical protein
MISDYAAHFFDMYVKNHDWKHMTGDQIKILILNLPFMLCDLVLPELFMCSSIYIISTEQHIVYDIIYNIVLSFEGVGQGCRREAAGAGSRIRAERSCNFEAPSLGSSVGWCSSRVAGWKNRVTSYTILYTT